MNPIEACEWAKASFFLFSDNVFDPLIYYSHLGPFVASFVLLIFLILVNRKEFLNRLLILVVGTFCLWTLFDLILWASEKPSLIMFFWSALLPLDLIIYMALFYFAFYFVFERHLPAWAQAIGIILWLPIFIFIASQYNINYFDLTNCEREGMEGILWNYVYAVEAATLGLIILILGWTIFSKINETKKKRSEKILVLVGVVLFLLVFSSGNILGSITSDWSIGQYGLFGMPVFIAFLAYSIVKYQTLNIKTLGVQVLVVAIIILIGAQLFFIEAFFAKVLTVITLLLIIFFGYLLIRSTKLEIEQKQQLTVIANQLADSNTRLKELDRQKSEFISIASHQLRTPLTAIKGYISLLLEGSYGTMNKDVDDVMNKIYSVNDRLVHLVEDLLNVSRIEAGRIQYNFQAIQLGDIVTELHDMFSMTAKNKGLQFTLELPNPSLPLIIADPNKIKEITSNLIDNAIKYTPAGSVTVSLSQIGENARIVVADTGIGIKPEDKEKLFTKFVRSQETSRMVVGGAGLGLYVGKSFVLAHKGNIWAESEGAGKGSRFIIELPLKNSGLQIGTADKIKGA